MLSRILIVALSFTLVASAQGQRLLWTQRVDQDTLALPYHSREVAIAVNRQGTDVMVAWIHDLFDEQTGAYDSEIWYNVSTNGSTFGTAGPLPLQEPHVPGIPQGGDPMVAFSRITGDGWVGALDNGETPGRFWICKKAPGSPSASVATEPLFGIGTDKGWLATGPAFGGQEVVGLFCNGKFFETGGNIDRLQAKTSADGGVSWTPRFAVGPEFDTGHHGNISSNSATNPTVVSSQNHHLVSAQQVTISGSNSNPSIDGHHTITVTGSHTFTVPVAVTSAGSSGSWVSDPWQNGNEGAGPSPVVLHSGIRAGRVIAAYRKSPLPEVTYSTDGITWVDSVPPTKAVRPGTTETEDIQHFDGLLDGGAPYSFFAGLTSLPAEEEKDLYMVFTAGGPTDDDGDLYIAHSDDYGENFSGPTNDLGRRVLHLTDDNLHDPAGTHQVFGWLTVDTYGRIHIVYYAAHRVQGHGWKYQAKYACILRFDPSNPSVVSFPLADEFDLETAGLPEPHWMGDYITIDCRGCEVYMGFMSRHEGGTLHAYVSKVVVPCVLADVATDGVLSVDDADAFSQYMLSSDPRADLNRDGIVNTGDVPAFLESLGCGCNP